MHRQATRSPKEIALLERFDSFYENVRSPVMANIERTVCGCDYGGNSWTTRVQAEHMAQTLGLRRGKRLLELGAGSGWPGLYMAETTGCDVALVDIPLTGLRLSAKRAASDGLARNVMIIAADAAALPFAEGVFDAVSHSDLLCCLEPKRAVLVACRRAIRNQGRMAFTVISVAPGVTAGAYRRAVANGPDFIETDIDYSSLLAETEWTILSHDDITEPYATSCKRQIEADEAQKTGLVALLGADEFAQRLAGWRAKLAALGDGLLRREMFVAAPGPN